QRDVAVRATPPAVSTGEYEGRAPGAPKRLSVRTGRIRRPFRRDPAGFTDRLRDRSIPEPEVTNPRPHVAPLLALDVAEARHGSRPGAEGDRVIRKETTAGREVLRANRSLEFTQPLDRFWIAHVLHYEGTRWLVNDVASRYPALMNPLTIDTLKTLASLEGLTLTDQELASLLPLV